MIKSEKGITLTSLIIYVIAMLITVTIITVVTAYFKKNVDINSADYTFFAEFTRFQSYFNEEVNKNNNVILEVFNGEDNNQSYIVFSSGNQYTYVPNNKAIYQNNVKIASGVQSCTFIEGQKNGKQTVKVNLKIQGTNETSSQVRSIEYVLQK